LGFYQKFLGEIYALADYRSGNKVTQKLNFQN